MGWAWSPIKFQADMGILLTFMFLWNMLGALILIPALSYFLLPGNKAEVTAPGTVADDRLKHTSQEVECSQNV
ncbi:hypothetical protein D3C77_476370 [compost metagenome]